MALQKTIFNSLAFANSTSLDVLPQNNIIPLASGVILTPKLGVSSYRDYGDGKRGKRKTVVDKNKATVDFTVKTHLRRGVLGSGVEIDGLLKSAGLVENGLVYQMGDGDFHSRADVYLHGTFRKVFNAVTNMKIEGTISEPVSFMFEAKGFCDIVPTPATFVPLPVKNDTILIMTNATSYNVFQAQATTAKTDGSSLNITSFSFDLQNEITQSYGVGMGQYDIVESDPIIKIECVKNKDTDDVVWEDFSNGTSRSILLFFGTLGGRAASLYIPRAVALDVSESDNNGSVKMSREYRCESINGNDNFTLTFF